MKEATGDLWSYPADLITITTNGFVKKNGAAVMGAGCAKEAKEKVNNLEYVLGRALDNIGNHTTLLGYYEDKGIASLPVKHNFWEKADIKLIERSIHELIAITDQHGFESVVIPRPGCGNGGLLWEDVRGDIMGYLDDRFTIIGYEGEE